MESAPKQPIDKEEAEEAFDIVIVPHGAIDEKLVVGRAWPGTDAKVDEKRLRSAKRVLAGRSDPTNLLEANAPLVLRELAETMDRLAQARVAFRQELLTAVAEGEALFKQAAA